MKVCFFGLGSIAVRHIRNLHDLYGDSIVIDAIRSGYGKEAPADISRSLNKVYYKDAHIPTDYDVIFITNPTREHYKTLQLVQQMGKHFFIEKPVFETGNEDLNVLHLKKDSVYYVACPLRYTNVIRYLKEHIDFSSVYSIRSISSSYLPEWRPGTDYRSSYSARREMGGGVSIDLIHEWDYLCYLLGKPQTVLSLIGKKSGLEIDSDDIAVYIAEYRDKLVELHLDYFGRAPVRTIELFGENDTIKADLITQTIEFKREQKLLDLSEDRDSYQKKELKHFFKIVNGSIENDNTILQACQTLKITRGEIL